MNLLTAEHLAIGYSGRVLARGVDLALETGTTTYLIGPNGAGKTTLFRTLLGLVPPLEGVVRVGGESIAGLSRAALARRIAYVPQAVAAELPTTVLDLVLMGRTAHLGAFSTPSRADHAIAMRALDALGIGPLAERDTARVSGGERQLALIARALAQEAAVVVMDEPTASLDLGNRVRVLDTIGGLAQRGLAVLVSTHEPEQAFAIADRVAILFRGGEWTTGNAETELTAPALSRFYGVPLSVETTASGARVVTRRR